MEKTKLTQEDVEKLKEDYEAFRKKYALPDFKELEEEFDIEKAVEKGRESKLILRDIRRIINDKISAYLHLFETFMNPSSGPIFVFSMIKNISEDDKKGIKEIYQKLAKIEITVLKLDTIYEEKAEADFIKATSKQWNEIKKEIMKLLEKFDKDFDTTISSTSRGYFG
jgi:hypothetical protein